MRVFLDANILFSAAKSDGTVRRVLEKLRDEGHALYCDVYVAEEARANLRRKYPTTLPEFEAILESMNAVAAARTAELDEGIELVAKDRPVLAAALTGRCDVLLTGDRRHFSHLMGRSIDGLSVHSVASIIELLW